MFRKINNGAKLIAIHKARYYKTKEGLNLGPGPFVRALEFATNIEAKVIGKPEESFFKKVVKDIGCCIEKEIVYMIGDV